jgi:hypothetical protein
MTSAIGPQNGSVTHHQDQAMFPVSLRPTNSRPSKPRIGIDAVVELFEFMREFDLFHHGPYQHDGEGSGGHGVLGFLLRFRFGLLCAVESPNELGNPVAE